ncbi:MAG: hypothetical protein MR428_00340 [Mesosutterella sp.]|nr:hypothetical protein [Mesosutterella sp.]
MSESSFKCEHSVLSDCFPDEDFINFHTLSNALRKLQSPTRPNLEAARVALAEVQGEINCVLACLSELMAYRHFHPEDKCFCTDYSVSQALCFLTGISEFLSHSIETIEAALGMRYSEDSAHDRN